MDENDSNGRFRPQIPSPPALREATLVDENASNDRFRPQIPTVVVPGKSLLMDFHKPRDVDTWRDGLVWAKWRVGVGFAHKGGKRSMGEIGGCGSFRP